MVISQNPTNQNSIPIIRSKNEKDGLEFSWSLWLFIKTPAFHSDPTNSPSKYKHIS